MTIVPWREVINKNGRTEMRSGKSQSSAVGTSSSKSKHNSSTSRGKEPHLSGLLDNKRRESSLTKKRNSMVQVQESQTLVWPHISQTLIEGQMNRKDVKNMKGHAIIPPDRSLDSSIASNKDGNISSHSGKERSSLSKGKTAKCGNPKMTIVPWREVINKNGHTELRSGKGQSQSKSSAARPHISQTSRGKEPSIIPPDLTLDSYMA